MIKKSDISMYVIIRARDNDLNIYYTNSNHKGMRPFLVVNLNLEKVIILPFNSMNSDRSSKSWMIELDEQPNSLLNVVQPKTVSLELVSNKAIYEGRLSQKSIDLIEESRKRANVFYIL